MFLFFFSSTFFFLWLSDPFSFLFFFSKPKSWKSVTEITDLSNLLFFSLDECKSPEEKEEEEYLLKRKVQLVAERNLIIDSMDEDRMR